MKLRVTVVIAFLCLLAASGCSGNQVPSGNLTEAQQNRQVEPSPQPQVKPEPQPAEQPGPADPAPPGELSLITATVTRVVDGDTIHVSINGKDETVRFIGVDTPETVHPARGEEPYGREASEFTKAQLAGKDVFLETDIQQRDKYGRLLAYVWLKAPREFTEEGDAVLPSDNEIRANMFNARLLLEGYAQVMTIPPNVKYADHFAAYQREARENNRGLWGLPGS